MSRVSWDQYFINIARAVSTRATCNRKHVGAVITKDRRILATGYNGSIRHTEHCDDDNHLMIDNHCQRTIHAEANALAQAAMYGIAINNSTIYCTALPCWSCFKLVVNAGIREIIYDEPYRAGEHIERIFQHAHFNSTVIRPVTYQKNLDLLRTMPLTLDLLKKVNGYE